MKVNVQGKGVIPGVKQLLPAFNIDLDKDTIYRILGSDKIAVFKADDCTRITRRNIDTVFTPTALRVIPDALTEKKPVQETKSTKKKVEKKPVVEETPITEVPIVEEAPVVEVVGSETESSTVDIVEDDIPDVIEIEPETPTTEEVVVEERPRYNKKKNKKNRNNQ